MCSSWNENGTTFADASLIGKQPVGIFVNKRDAVFVANRDIGPVLMWNNGSSTPDTVIRGISSNSWSFFVTSNGDIYVDNSGASSSIDKWAANATHSELVMKHNGTCAGLFIDSNYSLYCSSLENHTVLKMPLNYNRNQPVIIAGTGCPGPVINMLDHPHGIFVDKEFNLYVADTGNNRIQYFGSNETNGETLAGFGAKIFFILNRPTSVVLDADGYLFIVESQNHRIIRSTTNGFKCVIGCSGQSGAKSNQLNGPQSMAFDTIGNIYVTDFNNNRVQKFFRHRGKSISILQSLNPSIKLD